MSDVEVDTVKVDCVVEVDTVKADCDAKVVVCTTICTCIGCLFALSVCIHLTHTSMIGDAMSESILWVCETEWLLCMHCISLSFWLLGTPPSSGPIHFNVHRNV